MDSPSTKILAAAATTETCRDSLGRELVVRRMTALDRLRLFKAIGPVLSQNSLYLGMAMLASMVTSIDGVPIPAPHTEAQVEAVVAKLGDEGIAAAAEAHAVAQMQCSGSTYQGN